MDDEQVGDERVDDEREIAEPDPAGAGVQHRTRLGAVPRPEVAGARRDGRGRRAWPSLFQWVPADAAAQRFTEDATRQARAGEEMADVLIYLLRLADVLGVDLGETTRASSALNHRRFVADQVRGVAPDKR